MAIVSTMKIMVPDEILFETDERAPEIAVSGGLALLLYVYLREPSFFFHMCISTSGQLWDASIPVDHDCSAHDFLKSIEESYQKSTASQTSSLRKDSLTSVSHPEGSPIPRQILCTVKESGASRSLDLEISEKLSSAHARLVAQLIHVTRQLLAATSCRQTL
ncbi:hypothetical protein F4782DRAFT_533378 [Xylaria castorea]|nr:hypothetical protein F4782DRAFT_533378 [Xylaria castorea]